MWDFLADITALAIDGVIELSENRAFNVSCFFLSPQERVLKNLTLKLLAMKQQGYCAGLSDS